MSFMFRLMGPRWWAALAVATAFVLVFRTSEVGAPAQARDRSAALGVDAGITGHSIELLPTRSALTEGDEVLALQRALRAEQRRGDELARETARLQRQFDALTALTLDLLEEGPSDQDIVRTLAPEAPGGDAWDTDDLVPVPMEAIYVRTDDADH